MAATRRHPFTAALRRALLHPVALAYLAVVAAVWAWVAADVLFVTHQDASLSGVWAFFVTAPSSLLFVLLPGPLPWVGLVVAALLQAALLGAAAGRAPLRPRGGGAGRAGR
ncbi:SCO4225 family membrane protein [Streptomyces fuscigenes]|uniref:SCO4225 family membrane protein n=1 Tax=Streptomyces fuscigenes TaxID=1528880 RepID=UPI001F2C258C|nr:hypothetical protein [Streptomyces fuscigenes]MCF3964818.1 hypothetical protein [Streptomyces fuscigenes]